MSLKPGIVLILIFALSACTYGGAAMTGAQMVYDRHNLQKKLDDNYTTLQAYRAIYMDTDQFKNTRVSISTQEKAILLVGQIPDANQRTQIESIIRQYADGREVFDYTEIASPLSFLTKTSDSWITTKIKTQFIVVNDIDPTRFKVITENGVVYLMGAVKKDQADIATDIAKNTAGVQKVVTLFSYIEEGKIMAV